MKLFRRKPPRPSSLSALKTPVNPPAKTILIPLYPEDVLKPEERKGD